MRRTISHVAAATSVIVLVPIAGCSDEDGTGSGGFPLPGQTTSAAGNGPSGVPRVQNPLDASPFLSNPCQLVDDQIVVEFGPFQPGDPDVDSDMAKNLAGPGCVWDAGSNYGLNVDLRIETVHSSSAAPGSKGISGFYGGKEAGLVDYLVPLEIPGHPGYPAVDVGKNGDREKGDCTLHVGISDELTFKSSVLNEDNPEQACPAAQKVAAAVLDSLKKGA